MTASSRKPAPLSRPGTQQGHNDPRMSPNGGAIALGPRLRFSHPRITGTAAADLQLTGGAGRPTMCIGVGQGMTIALKRV